jgi:hypothetical protein
MTHLLSHVIAQLIVDGGFGKWADDSSLTAADYEVTYETMPDEHDYAIMAGEVEGKQEAKRPVRPGKTQPVIFPGCAVQVRAFKDGEAGPKARAVAAFLDAITCRRVTVETSRYLIQNFSRVYDPVFLMQEDRNDRRVWIFRGNVTITQEL